MVQQLLSINYNTVEADHSRGEVNEQSKQCETKQKLKIKNNFPLDSNNNKEIDYFLTGL